MSLDDVINELPEGALFYIENKSMYTHTMWVSNTQQHRDAAILDFQFDKFHPRYFIKLKNQQVQYSISFTFFDLLTRQVVYRSSLRMFDNVLKVHVL